MLSDKASIWGPAIRAIVLACAATFSNSASAEPPLLVQAVLAEIVPDQQILSLIGEIVAREEVGLSFPMGGRILSISVHEGDRVTKGQELARLESVQQKQALLAVEAALDAAQADLFQASEEFERQDKFLERGSTTRIRRDEAERRHNIALANIERAKAELKRAGKTFTDTFLYATSDGIIIARFADPGEVVTAARPILKVALGRELDAVFDAPESIPTIDPSKTTPTETPVAAQIINLELLDKPDIIFTGKVRNVSPLIDPRKGTVEITLSIDHSRQETLYGDAVRGTFIVAGPPRIIIPYSALTALGETPAVWVVDPQTHSVSLSPIAISRFSDGHVIVESGIQPGERIVTVGTQLLYPGRIVRLKGGD